MILSYPGYLYVFTIISMFQRGGGTLSTPTLLLLNFNLCTFSQCKHTRLALQTPWAEQAFGQPSRVQWIPFQPVTQRQVPFLHWPCRLHRGSHPRSWHLDPVHPSAQTQAVSSHLDVMLGYIFGAVKPN